MHGLTADEIELYAGRPGWGCLVAGVCVAAVALILACQRWPAVETWAPVLGLAPAGYAGLWALVNWGR
jgi:hypothetical protein